MRKILSVVLLASSCLILTAGPADAKPKVTKACADALDKSEEYVVFIFARENIETALQQAMVTALTANPTSPVAGLNGVTVAIQTATPKIGAAGLAVKDAKTRYDDAATKCRAGK